MNKILKENITEAFSSVLPISAIVLAVSVIFTPLPSGTILIFLAGTALLIIGMGFFTLGADMALMPMGEGISVELTKTSKLFFIIPVTLVIGFIISIAEPDLHVLGRQTPAIPAIVLIATVSVGMAVCLVISIIRILLKIRLSALLVVFYIIILAAAFISPNSFVPVGFDSGGVTTGPITVPFILAMGIGVASIRSDKNSHDDTFGLLGLCSAGPILAVMILGFFYKPGSVQPESFVLQDAATSRDVVIYYALGLPAFFRDVGISLGAIAFCFVVFQLITRRYHKHQLGRISVGFLYTLFGVVIFLAGVNIGFFPVGQLLGAQLVTSPFKWILIPLGALIGYFIVAAEPAVHILNKQVEEITEGAISQKMMNRGLSIGMSAALVLIVVRVLFSIHIMWILLPGYAFALILTFFVPRIFTGIAFDSGGVCAGSMSSAFLLPFAIGICEGVGGNVMIDAFGVVGIVAMPPLVVIQIMGLVYQFKAKEAAAMTQAQTAAIGAAGKAFDWGEITVYETKRAI